MGRWTTAALALVASAALFVLPRPDAVRLAASECGALLALAPPKPPGPVLHPPALIDSVLDGPALTRHDERSATLHLYGVRMASADGESDDLTVHLIAQRSLVRELRAAAARRGWTLAIDGEQQLTSTTRDRGASFIAVLEGPRLSLEYTHPDGTRLRVERPDWRAPRPSALLPALLALVIALVFRRPILGLAVGVGSAAALLRFGAGSGVLAAVAGAPFDVLRHDLPAVLESAPYVQRLVSIALALAMVACIGASGGLRGLSNALARLVRGARGAQLTLGLAGLTGVVDGYAHGLIAGAVLRPLTDRFRVSREKLAYLVDATGGALASVSILSTWVAWELATLAPQLPSAGLAATQGCAVLLATLPYRFYSLFTLALAAWVVLSGRDFGPMLGAERRARTTAQLSAAKAGAPTSDEPASGVGARAWRALLPLALSAAVFAVEFARSGFVALAASEPGLTATAVFGDGARWLEFAAQADAARALLFASGAGFALAFALALGAGAGRTLVRAIWRAERANWLALLLLSWCLADGVVRLGAPSYIADLLGSRIAPDVLPCLALLLAAATSLACASAWSSLGLLLPVVVVLAYALGERSTLGQHGLLVVTLAATLEGALLGRHVSPLADSSVIASTAAGAEHSAHLRTQIPYAAVTAGAALALGFFPATFLGWSPWWSLAAGAAALLMIVLVFGRKSDAPAAR